VLLRHGFVPSFRTQCASTLASTALLELSDKPPRSPYGACRSSYWRRIFSSAFPLASSSISLSK